MTTLSILIPTKNRFSALAETVEGFLNMSRRDDFVVFISDNASTDGYSEFVSGKCNDGRFSFRRQLTDIGLTGNILSLLRASDSEYVLIFGDDDAVRADFLDLVFKHIEADKPQLTKFPHEYKFTNDILSTFPVPGNTDSFFTFQRLDSSSLSAFEEKAGFISSHMFRRDLLLSVIEDITNFDNSDAVLENVYLTKLYTMMAAKRLGGFWIHSEVLVHQRVPSGQDRNFFSTPMESYHTAIESPAHVYSSLRQYDAAFAEQLLVNHFSKISRIRMSRKSGVPRTVVLKTLARYRPKLKLKTWFELMIAILR